MTKDMVKDIETLRKEINQLDDQLAAIFAQRMQTALAIAAYKKENNLPVLDRGREREILSRVTARCGDDLAV